jgi:hypothetical protein
VSARYRHHRRTYLDRLPAGVRLVARPSRWGNRHPIGEVCPVCGIVHDRAGAVAAHAADLDARTDDDLRAWGAPPGGAARRACYCPPGEGCHADVLVDLLDRLHPRSEDPS